MRYNPSYKNNELFLENVRISDIANEIGTPFYCYSKKKIIENYNLFSQELQETNHKICYSIKANNNFSIVKIFSQLNSGIDAVSFGEIYKAIKAGISPSKIIFAGVGKTEKEMENALLFGVKEFSIESKPELLLLNKVASKINKKAKISFRVNPDIDANTHDKISTGRKGDKFGIDINDAIELYKKAATLNHLEIFGISIHIGSQITSINPFTEAFSRIRSLFYELKKNNIRIKNLDFGGGVGIRYHDEKLINIKEYIGLIRSISEELKTDIVIAPGRSLIGSAGLLVSRVIYKKFSYNKKFVIIDAAMNDLMRIALYNSYHNIVNTKLTNDPLEKIDIVGPICETTDILGKDIVLQSLKEKDLLAFTNTGAYGSSMSNEYNSRPLIPEILVDNNKFSVIRRRPSYDEMMRYEI